MRSSLIGSLVFLVVMPAVADVVELKTGQRVDGRLTHATPTSVSIEVAGQVLTIETDRVRAIYFGAAPPPVATEFESLSALKALQSVTRVGVTYRDYATRLGDAKIGVDRGLLAVRTASPEAACAIETAIRYYTAVGRAWSANISHERSWSVGKSELPTGCRFYEEAKVREEERVRGIPTAVPRWREFERTVLFSADEVLQVFWAYASEKIAEAEVFLNTGMHR
jgi:hypothetical protein